MITLDLERLTTKHFADAEYSGTSCHYDGPCIIGTLMTEEQREWATHNDVGLVRPNNTGPLQFLTVEQAEVAARLQQAFDQRDTTRNRLVAYLEAKAEFLMQQRRPVPDYINVSNCAQLAAYLESLPEDYSKFNMGVFSNSDWRVRQHSEGKIEHCGTVACALGHGPDAGIPVPLEDGYWFRGRSPEWRRYGRLFIDYAASASSYWWQWCFSSAWKGIDNTPQGAAKRIRYMLKHSPDTVPPVKITPELLELYNA